MNDYCQLMLGRGWGSLTGVAKPKLTKVFTLTNHKRREQHIEPIRTRSKYMSQESAGKRVQARHRWIWVYL